MSKTKSAVTGGAAVIAITVPFLMGWEGMDAVAKRDMIGTGHPITYCNGLTSGDGDVKVGQRFIKEDCEKRLALALPKYLDALNKHLKAPIPKKSAASALDASFNAGSAAVGRSPMVANFNAGNVRAGCNAFQGWYISSDHQVRKGLVARRSGIGDGRKSERDLCLEGLSEPRAEWYVANAPAGPVEVMPPLADYKPPAASDPHACFGAGRYDAMRDGRTCPTASAEPPKRPWWRVSWVFKS